MLPEQDSTPSPQGFLRVGPTLINTGVLVRALTRREMVTGASVL